MADPVTMSLVGASTVIGVKGALAEGKAAEQAADFKAKTQIAGATKKAAEYTREGKIVESNARAAMAASGGAFDAGSAERIGKINEQSQYNALAAMYEGEQAAAITKYEGEVKKKATKMKALSTVLSGGAQMYSSYKSPAESTAPSAT